MSALFFSTISVALAEIGDKTQLLALLLATRFKKPAPIILAITIATLANHGLAAALGNYLNHLINPNNLSWIAAAGFILMGMWILIPDKLDDTPTKTQHWGAFLTTLVLFFLVEIGDKTQIATIVLATHYSATLQVITGTTVGMLLANVPVVVLGRFAADKLPLQWIRWVTALLFILLGTVTLLIS
ncbi:TMEM165/GDT1 family protein [Zooshikella harenae]|uniref:GDT1 family protein n=1 Tax=Zooshikella harenae TaxID=2827238 RepID=A0ABS5ZID1_9GAMM|nr:TMEM165/GDT1 family protein [Zooshikella harenae]MBU2713744.1 TMEM165/GDT1 family protein [Zooshikella harenae]